MSVKHLLPVIGLLAAAHTAHADAVADFKAGTTVAVDGGVVDLGDGPRSSSGSGTITKRAGTFDFALQASDLGLEYPVTIRLRGVLLTGGLIDFAVNETYSPRVHVGGGVYLSSLTGHVYMRALPLPGRDRHELGNVRLVIARPSFVVARGDWGSATIAVKKLELLGGIAQPTLAGFTDPTTSLICSGRAPTHHNFTLTLSSLARGTGAAVQLDGPHDTGVRVPSGRVVRAGSRTATVRARIEANFVGRARLTASLAGVARSLDVVVHPSTDCATR